MLEFDNRRVRTPRRRTFRMPSRLAWLVWLPALVGIGLVLWAFAVEPRRLVVHEVTLELPRWPAERRVRIALLADLHVGSPFWDLQRLKELVAETNRQKPELVLLAGDYLINDVMLGHWVDPESIAEVLRGLDAPLGTLAVLGNHDWWNDGERVRRAFEEQGIRVLENEAVAVRRGQTRFFVVGLADEMTRTIELERSIAQVPPGEPFLVLVHEPDIFADMDDRPALTLAGHTHGGQISLPFVGPLVVPSRHGRRYAAGHVVESGRHLFVTTGVGTSILPLRFRVPPEIAMLELR